MTKNLQAISIFFLGICILLGASILSGALREGQQEAIQIQSEKEQVSSNRYNLIPLANDYFVMVDSHTGEYWTKIGDGEWTKEEFLKK